MCCVCWRSTKVHKRPTNPFCQFARLARFRIFSQFAHALAPFNVVCYILLVICSSFLFFIATRKKRRRKNWLLSLLLLAARRGGITGETGLKLCGLNKGKVGIQVRSRSLPRARPRTAVRCLAFVKLSFYHSLFVAAAEGQAKPPLINNQIAACFYHPLTSLKVASCVYARPRAVYRFLILSTYSSIVLYYNRERVEI